MIGHKSKHDKYNKYNKYNFGKIDLECDEDQCFLYLTIFKDDNMIKINYDKNREEDKFFIYKNKCMSHIIINRLKHYVLDEINRIDAKLFRDTPQKLFIDSIEAWFNPPIINDVFI
jgi:hypothetical protein